MATRTLGTAATTSLTALVYSQAPAVMLPADLATMNALIKNDQGALHPAQPGSFTYQGQLFVPNRGVLKVLPGDVVAVDAATGWVILVSARAAAANPQWVLT